MKIITKCQECGRINRPSKASICDECMIQMNTPFKAGKSIFLCLILLSVIIYLFEYQIVWFLIGLLLGYFVKDVITKESKEKELSK